MKNNVMWVAVALMMATVTLGCSKDDDERFGDSPDPEIIVDNDITEIELTQAEQQLVSHSNDFAFNLFREITKGQGPVVDGGILYPDKSEIISPISITYALGMLNNGAAGETQKQINTVLGFGDTGADGINNFCRKMLTEAPKLDKLTKVLISNTIFMNKDYKLKAEFIKQAKTYYDAEPETRDFADGKTRDVINKWGNDHTEGMIPEVLTADEFSPSAVSYLLNAIYFKGTWLAEFDKANTQDEQFEASTGNKTVPMMRQEHEFGYAEDELCQALCLPYGNGAYSMTILLPKQGKSINDVLKTLTAETWQSKYRTTDKAMVNVKLPRFESNSDVDLASIMTALGMPRAFVSELAEFPNFCDVPTYIGLMKQVAKIKLSEEGTEAAAVTVVGMVNSVAVPIEPKRVDFHATRPFLYVISEQSTGAIFFIGKYVGD